MGDQNTNMKHLVAPKLRETQGNDDFGRVPCTFGWSARRGMEDIIEEVILAG